MIVSRSSASRPRARCPRPTYSLIMVAQLVCIVACDFTLCWYSHYGVGYCARQTAIDQLRQVFTQRDAAIATLQTQLQATQHASLTHKRWLWKTLFSEFVVLFFCSMEEAVFGLGYIIFCDCRRSFELQHSTPQSESEHSRICHVVQGGRFVTSVELWNKACKNCSPPYPYILCLAGGNFTCSRSTSAWCLFELWSVCRTRHDRDTESDLNAYATRHETVIVRIV